MKPYYAVLLIPPLIIAIRKLWLRKRLRRLTKKQIGELYGHRLKNSERDRKPD